MHTAQVTIRLETGQTIPLSVIEGTVSHTFTGFGVDRPVTVFQNGVATVDNGNEKWPIRLDTKKPAVSGIDAEMPKVKEIRLVQ